MRRFIPERTSTLSVAGLAIAVGFWLAGAVRAQEKIDRAGEVPWRSSEAALAPSDTGPSRLLPPVDDTPRTAVRWPRTDPPMEPRPDFGAPAPQAAPPDATTTPPEHWWKEDAADTVVDPEHAGHGRGVSPRGEIILSTQILAMVGSQPILAGDLLARINELLKPLEDKVSEDELDKQRWLLMERLLPPAIEAKLVFLDFIRGMEDKQLKMIEKNVFEQFDEKQLPELIDRAGVSSAAELDAKFRSFGSSLSSVRRSFFEQVAAREMIRKNSEDNREVTHDELLVYYHEHPDLFEFKSQARWEHMMVRFDRFATKQEAFQALGEMGNAVLRGTPFEVVARRYSHGPRAEYGGRYDWTFQGSLASEVLDEAIFTLPVGHLSDRLEDETGFHIVRVIERKEAGRTPFVEAQVTIREKIKEERRDERVKQYLERLKRETYVWNYFDEPQR